MRSVPFALCVAPLLLVPACDRPQPQRHPVPAEVAPAPGARPQHASEIGAPLDELAAAVPARADGYILLDLRQLVAALAGLSPEDRVARARTEAIQRDLGAAFERLLGPDPSRAQVGVAFAHVASEAVAMVIAGDFGATALAGATLQINGVPAKEIDDQLLLARVGPWLVIGNPAGLESVIAVRSGKAASLARSAQALAALRRSVGRLGVAHPVLSAVSRSGELLGRLLDGSPLAGAKVEAAAAALGADASLAAAVEGPKDTRTRLKMTLDAATGALRRDATKRLEVGRSSDDLVEALSALSAGHSTLALLEGLSVKDDGGALLVEHELPLGGEGAPAGPLFVASGVIAVLAAVAVPAFLKYQRRAKTTEAVDQLDRIYKGAAMYYGTPHVNHLGRKLPCQFPASAKPTPWFTCCRAGGNDDGRCGGSPDAWATATWSALDFEIRQPHYFVYAFDSSGTNGAAAFTATANADLDCDGIQSTFQRMAFADPRSSPAECSMSGNATFYVDKETE